MESKYNYLVWRAELMNYDLEKITTNFFESLLNDFGLVNKDNYEYTEKYSFQKFQRFILENGSFRLTTIPNHNWCSISLEIHITDDFDIDKFKNTIKIELNTEEIKDTIDLILRKYNI
jgi:hypothetical protein